MLNGWICPKQGESRCRPQKTCGCGRSETSSLYGHMVINQELVVFVCGEDTHTLNMSCIPRIRMSICKRNYHFLFAFDMPLVFKSTIRFPCSFREDHNERFRDFSSLPRSSFFLALGFQFLFCIEYQSQLFRLIYMVRQLMKASWDTLPPLTTDLKVFSNWNQLRVSWVDDDPIQHTNFHIHFSYFHKHLVQIRPPRNSNHYSRLISQVKHLVMSNL